MPKATLTQGAIYQAAIDAPWYATNGAVKEKLEEAGFSHVDVSSTFPATWPAELHKGNTWASGTWSKESGEYDVPSEIVAYKANPTKAAPNPPPAPPISPPAGKPPKVPPPASSNVHAWAAGIVRDAWTAETGAAPTLAERQGAQAVGLHETSYGKATKPPEWAGSHNWGAVQCCKPNADGTCPSGSFLSKDYDAKSDKTYAICFKSYPDDLAGARDLVRHLTKLRPQTRAMLATGDADAIAAAMYAERYFGGFGKTDRERIEGYAKALETKAATLAKACGEDVKVTRRGGASYDASGKLTGFGSGASSWGSDAEGPGFWTWAGLLAGSIVLHRAARR